MCGVSESLNLYQEAQRDGGVLGVCCNHSGLELQRHCKASLQMHCKTCKTVKYLQRLTAAAHGPTLVCMVEID